MVVEAAPVVPDEEDRGRVPVGAPHDRVDQLGDVGLSGGDERGRVLADALVVGMTQETAGSVPVRAAV